MHEGPTTAEKLRGLPWSYAANATNSVFAQLTFGGPVFVLFLDSLGLSKSGIGFLLSLFPFVGLTALVTAPAVARFGYRRTYLLFWGARKFVIAFLLFTPGVLSLYGAQGALAFITVIVAIFALCRALGETAHYPWVQEYVPNAVRGKYAAADGILSTLAQFGAVAVAGYVIATTTGQTGFMVLIGVGFVFGLLSVWSSSHIPGGAPVRAGPHERAGYKSFARPLRDVDFRRYLAGIGLMTLTSGPLASFLPLFMREQVGLEAGQVVWLQTASLAGGLLSSYVWGWAADRYGSKPVMLSGLTLVALLSLGWMLMPRHTVQSYPVALGIAVAQGVVGQGWAIGSARQLFVSLIPAEHKAVYSAVFYAWAGAIGGISQLLAGWLLDRTAGLSGTFLTLTIDPYSLLFLAGLGLPLLGGLLLRGIRTDSRLGVGEFAGLFVQGNPFLAAESLIRYYRAHDEDDVVVVTERLGQARSPLTTHELLETLADPRFNVRFEAITTMARLPPDERLLEALSGVLRGGEPALSVVAAWALGRMGDPRAVPVLHEALGSRYRSVQAHSVRALGTLKDASVVPLLLERLAHETDPGLQMAYASALGKLQVEAAIGPLLALLSRYPDKDGHLELALAAARLVGDEHHFIQLWRQGRTDLATATAQGMAAFKRRLSEGAREDWMLMVDECTEALARGQFENGRALLRAIIARLPPDRLTSAGRAVLADSASRLAEFGDTRLEYLLLTVHALLVGWRPVRRKAGPGAAGDQPRPNQS